MPEVSNWIGAGSAAAEDDGEPAPDIAAGYIADMTAQIAHLARSAELGMLAYLLDMAAAEARGAVDAIGGESHATSRPAR